MVRKDHYDQIANSNNQYAKLKKFRICNHAIALLSTRGHHSPRNKGKPPTALCFDTAFCMYLFYHFSIKKQSNVRYIFAQKIASSTVQSLGYYFFNMFNLITVWGHADIPYKIIINFIIYLLFSFSLQQLQLLPQQLPLLQSEQ